MKSVLMAVGAYIYAGLIGAGFYFAFQLVLMTPVPLFVFRVLSNTLRIILGLNPLY